MGDWKMPGSPRTAYGQQPATGSLGWAVLLCMHWRLKTGTISPCCACCVVMSAARSKNTLQRIKLCGTLEKLAAMMPGWILRMHMCE